jgi:hypothetical protein
MERPRNDELLNKLEELLQFPNVAGHFAKANELASFIARNAPTSGYSPDEYFYGRMPNWVKVKTAHGRHIDEDGRRVAR